MQFSASTPGTYTPVANSTDLNGLVLTVLTVGQMAKVKMINWGGLGTSLVGYVTRWGRITNTPATPTARPIQATGSPTVTPQATANTYGTVATGTAETQLFRQSWNVQGGGGVVVLPIGGEWFVVGGALGTLFNQIGVGNVSGADANLSNYGTCWEE
jgi:hypothetical protein